MQLSNFGVLSLQFPEQIRQFIVAVVPRVVQEALFDLGGEVLGDAEGLRGREKCENRDEERERHHGCT